MGHGGCRPLDALQIGDEIVGTELRRGRRRYVVTSVLGRYVTMADAYRVIFGDGSELIASSAHPFLTHRGWRPVTPLPGERARLRTNHRPIGTGGLGAAPTESVDYRRGYLCGRLRGEDLVPTWLQGTSCRASEPAHGFWLALLDRESLARAREYLTDLEFETHAIGFHTATTNRAILAVGTGAQRYLDRLRDIVSWPAAPTEDWARGFLAGVFDAHGSYRGGELRLGNDDLTIIETALACLRRLGWEATLDINAHPPPTYELRVAGDLRAQLQFLHRVEPAITRTRALDGLRIERTADLRITAIEPLGRALGLISLATGTGDFIAGGVVCQAEPARNPIAAMQWYRSSPRGNGSSSRTVRKAVSHLVAPLPQPRRAPLDTTDPDVTSADVSAS